MCMYVLTGKCYKKETCNKKEARNNQLSKFYSIPIDLHIQNLSYVDFIGGITLIVNKCKEWMPDKENKLHYMFFVIGGTLTLA